MSSPAGTRCTRLLCAIKFASKQMQLHLNRHVLEKSSISLSHKLTSFYLFTGLEQRARNISCNLLAHPTTLIYSFTGLEITAASLSLSTFCDIGVNYNSEVVIESVLDFTMLVSSLGWRTSRFGTFNNNCVKGTARLSHPPVSLTF